MYNKNEVKSLKIYFQTQPFVAFEPSSVAQICLASYRHKTLCSKERNDHNYVVYYKIFFFCHFVYFDSFTLWLRRKTVSFVGAL